MFLCKAWILSLICYATEQSNRAVRECGFVVVPSSHCRNLSSGPNMTLSCAFQWLHLWPPPNFIKVCFNIWLNQEKWTRVGLEFAISRLLRWHFSLFVPGIFLPLMIFCCHYQYHLRAFSLPNNQISRLQRLQNTAAHIVTLSRKVFYHPHSETTTMAPYLSTNHRQADAHCPQSS